MSAFSTSLVNCPDLQTQLEQFYEYAMMANEEFHPYLNFLTSGVNRNGFAQMAVNGRGGKKRTVEYIYTPRLTTDDVTTAITRNCTTGNKRGHLSSECDVDLEVGAEVKEDVDILELASICEDNDTFFAKLVASQMAGVKLQIENQLYVQAAAGVGGFDSKDTTGVAAGVKSIETTKDSDPDPSGLREIRFTARTAGLGRGVYTFSGAAFDKYIDTLESGCCNDAGISFDEFFGTSGIIHSYSPYVEDAFGTDEFLVTTPGAAQLVSVPLFEGSKWNEVNSPVSYSITITDPETGLAMDHWGEKLCGTEWTIGTALAFKLCIMPDDFFGLNDHASGVNGLFNFNSDNT